MKKVLAALLLFGILSCSENKKQRPHESSHKQDTLVVKVHDTVFLNKREETCVSLGYINSYGKSSFYFSEITEEEYVRQKREDYYRPTFYSNSDSIELILQQRYPDVFQKKDGAYLFNLANGEPSFEVRNNLVQEKSYSRYQFEGEFQDYVFIYQQYYERMGYILINVKTGLSFWLAGQPRFISESLVYGIGGYSGIVDISIIDLENNRTALLSYENFDILESYPVGRIIYFKVRCSSNFNKFDYFGIQLNR
ncbi:MAG: hypothetical protein JKY22_08255 [Flavobacteriaceae bacterium]|nr:hypothetical protein [Flavobacteriaceae bacterium]